MLVFVMGEFYCEECRRQNRWVRGFTAGNGQCSLCGKSELCYDVVRSEPEVKQEAQKQMPVCGMCRRQGIRSEKYDAYFCEHCNVWIEHFCYEKTCVTCAGRPSKPLEVVCTS